jgi:DNA-binding GntR family transcriptional regulator
MHFPDPPLCFCLIVVSYDNLARRVKDRPTMAALLPLEVPRIAAPLRQQVEGVLRRAIIDGRLAPLQRLTERELMEMTGVSRTLVREALRQLESEGLIAVVPNKGAVVRELTAAEAKDLYAIRAVLEGLAARFFVENAGDAARASLMQAGDAVVAAYRDGDFARALETKNRFYDVLFEGARSETLSAMLNQLHARIWRWRALGVTHPRRSPQRGQEAARGLAGICAAIRRKDAEAAERATREEAQRGGAEVLRLLVEAAPVRRAARR